MFCQFSYFHFFIMVRDRIRYVVGKCYLIVFFVISSIFIPCSLKSYAFPPGQMMLETNKGLKLFPVIISDYFPGWHKTFAAKMIRMGDFKAFKGSNKAISKFSPGLYSLSSFVSPDCESMADKNTNDSSQDAGNRNLPPSKGNTLLICIDAHFIKGALMAVCSLFAGIIIGCVLVWLWERFL